MAEPSLTRATRQLASALRAQVATAASRPTLHRGSSATCFARPVLAPTASTSLDFAPQRRARSMSTGSAGVVGDSGLASIAGVTPLAAPTPMLAHSGLVPRAPAGLGSMPLPDAGRVHVSDEKVEEDVMVSPFSTPTHPFKLEAHVAPKHTRREFGEMFGVGKEVYSRMSLLTVTIRSKQDMATWSSELVEEREVLLKEFHMVARRAVDNLRAAGHWADFVDPLSGEAQLAAKSTGSFTETDDRLALFGYRILDLGCCKAVSHPEWGTHVMVGAVFTDAPFEIVDTLGGVVSDRSPPMTVLTHEAPAATATASTASAAAPSK